MYRTIPYNRSRSRGEISNSFAVRSVHNKSDGAFVSQASTSAPNGVIESIQDIYTPFGDGVWPMKPMFSRRIAISSTQKQYPCPHCGNASSICYGTAYQVLLDEDLWGNNSIPDARHPDVVSLPADVRSELGGRLQSKLPSLYRRLPNVARALGELKDMAATVKQVADTLRVLGGDSGIPNAALAATMASLSNPDFRGNKARVLKNKPHPGIPQTAAGDWLAYAFAIEPYVDDMKKLYKRSAGVLAGFEELRRGVGKVHTLKVHAKRSSSSIATTPETVRCSPCAGCPYSTSSDVSPNRWTDQVDRYSTFSGITLKYRYTMPRWTETVLTQGEALISYLKAGLNSRTVFELLPFSFVLEWFLNTDAMFSSRPLGFNSNANRDCITEIVEVCLTHVIEEGISKTVRSVLTNEVSQVATNKYVYRWTGDQAINHLQWVFTIPHFMQFALGAAIVASGTRIRS